VTTADFAAFSNNAIAFASMVYVLAFLSHVAEWAWGRNVPVAALAREPLSVGAGAPLTDAPSTDLSETDPDTVLRVETFGRIGLSLTVLAALVHLAGLVSRGLASDPIRVPWGNMYEFAVVGSFGVTLMYLLLIRKYKLRWLGLPVTGFAIVVLMLAVLLLYVPAGPLVPALQSYWLVIHVLAAATGAGAFTVGAMASVLFLIRERAERRGTLKATGYIARLPESKILDRSAYRVHAFGFPIWTFAALVAGPIWAQYAWGRYWGWDPKEVWAFITWVVYAAYLHARATAGWKGRAAAVIALIGFATVLFNFVGINLFGSGLHSYSGLD
jgi:cytochrome c-type biogenesis protein CcsB